jgi:opacity protein-like surface antigen
MKRLLLLVLCIISFVSTGLSQTEYGGEKGVSSIGVIAGYAVDNKTFAAGLDFRYNILEHIRLAPSVLYLFKQDSTDAWYVNVDAHYLLRATEKITVYPIVGLGLSARKTDAKPAPAESEEGENSENSRSKKSTSTVRVGLNMGVGVEKRITKDIILGAEFKYNLTTERIYDQAMFSGRIAYYF